MIKTVKSRVGDLDVVRTINVPEKTNKEQPKPSAVENTSPEVATKQKVLSKKK